MINEKKFLPVLMTFVMFATATVPIDVSAKINFCDVASQKSLSVKEKIDINCEKATDYTKYVLHTVKGFVGAIPSGQRITVTSTYKEGNFEMTAYKDNKTGEITFDATYTAEEVKMKVSLLNNNFTVDGMLFCNPTSNTRFVTLIFNATATRNNPNISYNSFATVEQIENYIIQVRSTKISKKRFGDSYNLSIYNESTGTTLKLHQNNYLLKQI